MQSPISEAERARLVEELQIATRTPRHKKLIFEALDAMATADGTVTETERAVMNEVKQAINKVDVGVLAQIGKLVGFTMQKRTAANAPNRERNFEDYIRNRVYYAVAQRLHVDQAEVNIPEEELRKLSLAGGLMAKVAHVDENVTDAEFDAIVAALQQHWEVAKETAVFVAEVAISEAARELDHHRLVRRFADWTTAAERRAFLNVLFAVAAADGQVSYEETEEIRAIANSLHMPQEEFITAKLTIPREYRAS